MNRSFWVLVFMCVVLAVGSAVLESPLLMLVVFMVIAYLILNVATRKKELEVAEE